jgi:hypothetical protein
MPDQEAGRRTLLRINNSKRVRGSKDECFAAIETECEALGLLFALPSHRNGAKRRAVDIDLESFGRSDKDVRSVRLTAQYGREEAHHCRPVDGPALVIPGSVTRDSHGRMAAMPRMPLIDRRESPFVEELLKLREVHGRNVYGLAGFGHKRVIGLLRGAAQGRSSRHG